MDEADRRRAHASALSLLAQAPAFDMSSVKQNHSGGGDVCVNIERAERL
jgi:hypothetical protein